MVYKSTNITGTDHGDHRFRNVSIQVNIKHGDLIVLGTDGLFDNLSDEVPTNKPALLATISPRLMNGGYIYSIRGLLTSLLTIDITQLMNTYKQELINMTVGLIVALYIVDLLPFNCRFLNPHSSTLVIGLICTNLSMAYPLVNVYSSRTGKSPFYSWVNQRTKWPFSIAM